MKKFHFRLEPVLKIKEKALDDKMLELAKITGLYQEEEGKLGNLANKKQKVNNDLIKLYQSGECLDIQEVQSYKDYLISLGSEMIKQEHLLIQIRKAVEEKQNAVREALKEKNILEKLKEKQSQKHYSELLQKEAIELDDIAISRYKAV